MGAVRTASSSAADRVSALPTPLTNRFLHRCFLPSFRSPYSLSPSTDDTLTKQNHLISDRDILLYGTLVRPVHCTARCLERECCWCLTATPVAEEGDAHGRVINHLQPPQRETTVSPPNTAHALAQRTRASHMLDPIDPLPH